jgi:thiol:disulfide interchange protein
MMSALFLAQTDPSGAFERPVDVFPWPGWMVATAAGLALLLIGLAAWLIIRWLKKRPTPPPPTPREVALAELSRARAQIETVDPYAFSILVSDSLRRYLTAQFQLRATEQTSPEFLESVRSHARFSQEETELLAAFLERCDLIKFARIDATQEDSAALLDEAVRFVKGGTP